MSVQFLYITAGSEDEAQKLASALVQERLVACVNIICGMKSVYEWKGEVQLDNEVSILAKTTSERVDEVIERVRELHSYECPCVVALPVSGGHKPFLEWIEQQTLNPST